MSKMLNTETRLAVESLVEMIEAHGGDAAAKKLLTEVHERYAKHDPAAYRAWVHLVALLDSATNDPQVKASAEAGQLAALLATTVQQGFFRAVRSLGVTRPEEEVLDLLGDVIQEQRTSFMVRNRPDQQDMRVFQDWLRASGVRVDRIPDLQKLPSGSVPDEVRLILIDSSADALRRWYLGIHPDSLKAGRPPTKKTPKTRRKAST